MKFGIVFGGVSWEHEISIVSAVAVKNVLKSEMSFIFVDKFRDFYLIEKENMKANFFSSSKYLKCKKLSLSREGFYLSSFFGEKKLDVDCYVNLIHGSDGEDGKIAGMFEFFGLNFIGPRLEASVMSFSKVLTKFLAVKSGVKTLECQILKRDEEPRFAYPIIVKPARLGSSIGVSVVDSKDKLDYALDLAYEFDDEILIEPFVNGVKEYNLAGFLSSDGFVFSNIEEPKKADFLDFEQKYLAFSNENRVKKAEISQILEDKLKDAFKKIYSNGFSGALIRCDFFVIDDEVYLNEVNPNPGSLSHYLFDDFTASLTKLAKSIKAPKKIEISYNFINSISSMKGGKL